MNIKILDSWLKDYVKTDATPQEIAKAMSLTSISIERVEPYQNDFTLDIEVTTNRPDLMSVVGLAREAGAILPQFGKEATFIKPNISDPGTPKESLPLTIINDQKLVDRICAVVMEVKIKKSPQKITDRLEASDIRSLNNVIDVTNYIMRTIGHPAHVFDYDRIAGHTIKVRESQKGETITTLDGKTYTLPGGDIVAEDSEGKIIDLLGIMGLENSVVTNDTKRIILFINNNNRHRMRKTSMTLGIRTEAVQMNEKGIDPELAFDALLYGIQLYKDFAEGRLASEIIDIYPQPYKPQTVSVTLKKIQQVMGIPLPLKDGVSILEKLGFEISTKDETITATIPSYRAEDIAIPEDLIEEIARVYGYHNLPTVLPPVTASEMTFFGSSPQFWETRIKNALKYWGMTEVYTYPMVSEEIYEGPVENAVKLANPLGEEFVYLRRTLVPSLLKVVQENKQEEVIKIFELANVYEKQSNDLPQEIRTLAGVISHPTASFFEVKGILEQLITDIGIKDFSVRPQSSGGLETEMVVGNKVVGTIEVLDEHSINFELNFEQLIIFATLHKTYQGLAKYPPVIEDLSFIISEDVSTGDIIDAIKKQHTLIRDVTLLDRYQDSRTFHILYQASDKNLTTQDITEIRNMIITSLEKKYHAKLK